MGSHPLNLAVRFLLELAALVAMGYWGWTQNDGIWRWVLVIVVPIAAAALWGTFAVPNDPSRSGNAPVPTPGMIRLILELAFFALATILLIASQRLSAGVTLAVIVIIHYTISYDRILWLLKN
jgi:hypothetical protein